MRVLSSRLFIILFILVILNSALIAQVIKDSTAIDVLLFDFLESISEDEKNQDFYDLIDYHLLNKIDLNSCDRRELSSLPFFDDFIADKILNYRESIGSFKSVHEIFNIPNVENRYLKLLFNFAKINPIKVNNYQEPENQFNLFPVVKFNSFSLRSRIQSDLQNEMGFVTNKYAGSKLKNYNRFSADLNTIKFNYLSEKDPGEESYNDFSSFSLSLSDYHLVKKLIVGDYKVEHGQGLALWSPYSFGKSIESIKINKSNRGILPYTSSDENQFFRGSAIELDLNNVGLSMFYSNHNKDASINTNLNKIKSLTIDGYHRTKNEIAKIDLINEKVFGSIIRFNLISNLNISFLYYRTIFEKKFHPDNPFDFKDSLYNFYSLSYSYTYKLINLTGEFSYNNISVASINNLFFNMSENLSVIFSFRNYPVNYNSLHSSAFSEASGRPKNEIGFYSGIRLKTNFGLFNFYLDQFKFPFSSNSNPVPTSGNEMLLYYSNKVFQNTLLNIKFKRQDKETTTDSNDKKIINKKIQTNYQAQINYSPSAFLRLKSRFEFVTFSNNNISESGFLVSQNIRFRLNKNFMIEAALALFETDSYDTRLYLYENDLDGVMLNSMLYEKGVRFYTLIKYDWNEFLRIGIKYSETFKPDKLSLSSGNSEIIGNIDNKFGLQLDMTF